VLLPNLNGFSATFLDISIRSYLKNHWLNIPIEDIIGEKLAKILKR